MLRNIFRTALRRAIALVSVSILLSLVAYGDLDETVSGEPGAADEGGIAAGATQRRILIDGIAAFVNKHVVSIGDVLLTIQSARRQLEKAYEGQELREKLSEAYENALNALIDRHLILDFYEKQEMKLPDEAVDQRIEEIINEAFRGDRGELMDALLKENLTMDEWRSEVRNQIIASFIRTVRIDRNVRISPKAVMDAYVSAPDKYALPDKIKLRMIALRKTGAGKEDALKRQEAEDVRRRLAGGEDFATVAAAVSEGSKAAEGGDWGWIEPGILRPELAKAAVELRPPQISEVIETQDELYILKVEGRRNKALASFREAQPEIEQELREKEKERLYKAWAGRLRNEAYVKVIEADLIGSFSEP